MLKPLSLNTQLDKLVLAGDGLILGTYKVIFIIVTDIKYV